MTDLTQRGVQIIDDNGRTVSTGGLITSNSITFTTTGTNYIPVFHITGTVQVLGLWGVVTTTMGNHTAAYFRLNDQSNTSLITAAAGVTLTGLLAGTVIVKKALVNAALTLLDNAQERVSEPTTLETPYFSPFVVVKKTGAVTDIEYSYITSDSTTTGVIQFFVNWFPISADGRVTPV